MCVCVCLHKFVCVCVFACVCKEVCVWSVMSSKNGGPAVQAKAPPVPLSLSLWGQVAWSVRVHPHPHPHPHLHPHPAPGQSSRCYSWLMSCYVILLPQSPPPSPSPSPSPSSRHSERPPTAYRCTMVYCGDFHWVVNPK